MLYRTSCAIFALALLEFSEARKIYKGCFKTIAFDQFAITDSERSSSTYVTDQIILDQDY